MNCRHARRVLDERHDDVPSSEKQAALETHLAACASCAQLAQEMDLTFQWLRELPDAQLDESFDWRLRLRLSKLEQEPDAGLEIVASPERRIWTLQFAGSAALAAGVVLVAGLFLFGGSRESGPRLVDTPSTGAPLAAQPSQPPTSLTQSPFQRPAPTPVQWPRPVPVRYGTPLGPQHQPLPAPSILDDLRAGEEFMSTMPADSVRDLKWTPQPQR